MKKEDHFQFSVNAQEAGIRLDQFLVQQFQRAYSRSYLQYLIDQGKVLVNGKEVKRHDLVREDDRVEGMLEKAKERPWLEPEDIPLDILYEDDDLIVINKPSGMVVHPACGNYTGTLVHALLAHCRSLSKVGDRTRPGIVHRLDKDTSGIILAAKTDTAHYRLAEQFASRSVKKKYLSIVRGKMVQEEGVIHFAIGRHPVHRKKMAVADGSMRAREAHTKFKVLERFKRATYLELEPTTGRTHQLRVHLSAIGHPILGDKVYGAGFSEVKIPRLALHASQLTFLHPRT
ncbi:MAG: RluA family pseudouridine synthase, partial [Candidatus Omnitrophica bacterium]|nr:RluA family pseudouridine synthase [Candidatus Omnitrophota bacterium]